MPVVKYLFESPEGRVAEASEKDLGRPLILSLEGTHDSLTLRDYFHAIEQFLIKQNPDKLVEALRVNLNDPSLSIDSISEIDLYSVKVGAFYHIAEVNILCKGTSAKFAVSAAFTPSGRKCLENDFRTVSKLRELTAEPCLPRPYFIGTPGTGTWCHNFRMALWEWLEGFHEWHFSTDRNTGDQRIVLWDSIHGMHFLNSDEEKEIFRQIARILTLCFNTENTDQVCRWHHAAGDFIVNHQGHSIETRLTTVREYHPVLDYQGYTQEDINLHLLFFFLDLTVRISMDRLDGTDTPVWADSTFLTPVIQGFMEGLSIMEDQKRIGPGQAKEFMLLLKSMSVEELRQVFQPLREIYQHENSMDSQLISDNLEDHIKNLYKTLQIKYSTLTA